MVGSPDWDLYRSLLAVIETGSLSAAARALGVAQPTVGRHVESLERSLGGAPLFTRSGAGLRPTRAALDLAPHARAMAIAAEALLRAASGDAESVQGVVRLTASDVVGAEILPPILREFRADHPRVDIELALSNRQEDLLRRDADVAVRMARPTQGALFARRIGAVRASFHAHRDYILRHGAPESLADLTENHAIIGFDRARPPPEALARLNLEVRPDLFALRTDNDLAQIAALRAAFGVAAIHDRLAARDPALVPVLSGVFGFEMEMWVVMHEDLKADRRLRLLFDHLVRGLKAYAAG